MLVRELPPLFEGRTRRAVLEELETTEQECKEAEDLAIQVEERTRELLSAMTPLPDMDLSRLDTARDENCQNELSADSISENCKNEPSADDAAENCQNEPAAEADSDSGVDNVNPDGRPVYLTERDWNRVQYQRTHGDTHSADQYDAFARRQYLARQKERDDNQP